MVVLYPIPIDPYIEEMLNGKRVIFVAPSSHLMGKGLGEWIDSFDVVCRCNKMPAFDNLYADYGRRCDIYFHSGTLKNQIEYIERTFRYYIDKMPPKVVFFPRRKPQGEYLNILAKEYPEIYVYHPQNENRDIAIHYSQFYYGPNAKRSGITTGLLGLTSLLSFGGMIEVNLTGFDFYASGKQIYHPYPVEENGQIVPTNELYNSEYEDQIEKFGKPVKNFNHEVGLQVFITLELMKEFDCIKVDDVLQNVLDNYREMVESR